MAPQSVVAEHARPGPVGSWCGPADGAVRVSVLGPLRVWRDNREVDAGPRQQAYLLALVLAQHGRPISKVRLIELLWGDDVPRSAVNTVHKYIGALRRVMEPCMSPRAESSFLRRRGDSYLWVASSDVLDLAVFRSHVAAAQLGLRAGDRCRALAEYTAALSLWRGVAGDGFVHGPLAVSLFADVNGEFVDACVAASELALSPGQAARLLPALRLAAAIEPLNEPIHAAWIGLLAGADRQADALNVYHSIRTRLATELGVDPGSALDSAYQRVLHQSGRPPAVVVTSKPAEPQGPRGQREAFVGRSRELAVLKATLDRAGRGHGGSVFVEGEPGVGKSRLLEEFSRSAAGRGACVVRGRCWDQQGAPALWPWVEIVGGLVDELPDADRGGWVSGRLAALFDLSGAAPALTVRVTGNNRFTLAEGIEALVHEVSSRQPVVVIIDDLQWADRPTLEVLAHLASRCAAGVLLVGAFRDSAPPPGVGLTGVLGAASSAGGHRRVRLDRFTAPEVAEFVGREYGAEMADRHAGGIFARTAGNAFFVQELARLLAQSLSGADACAGDVPSTVRDVIRHRMAGLTGDESRLLHIASIMGRSGSLRLLAAAADLEIGACLELLESAQDLGLVELRPGSLHSFGFVHDIVRESIEATLSPRCAARVHLQVADAIESAPADVEAGPELAAYHLWRAGVLADPGRTATAMVRAARRHVSRFALAEADEQLQAAIGIARTEGLPEVELTAISQLLAIVGMRSLYADVQTGLMERAEDLARGLGREIEATRFLFLRWSNYQQGLQLGQAGPLARRLLVAGEASSDMVARAYGLSAWATHQWNLGHFADAFDRMSRSEEILRHHAGPEAGRSDNPVHDDLLLLITGLFAEITALRGDLDGSRAMLGRMEAARRDSYAVTVWASMSTRIAVLAGDPEWARQAADGGIAADPQFSSRLLGTYLRLAGYWAQVRLGERGVDAVEAAEQLISANLVHPLRSGAPLWHGVLAEMQLIVGRVDQAAHSIDRAEHLGQVTGQRTAESLVTLVRAQTMRAAGEPDPVVRAVADAAVRVARRQGTPLLEQRAATFLSTLDGP